MQFVARKVTFLTSNLDTKKKEKKIVFKSHMIAIFPTLFLEPLFVKILEDFAYRISIASFLIHSTKEGV